MDLDQIRKDIDQIDQKNAALTGKTDGLCPVRLWSYKGSRAYLCSRSRKEKRLWKSGSLVTENVSLNSIQAQFQDMMKHSERLQEESEGRVTSLSIEAKHNSMVVLTRDGSFVVS